jgi:hypothetical protein
MGECVCCWPIRLYNLFLPRQRERTGHPTNAKGSLNFISSAHQRDISAPKPAVLTFLINDEVMA